MRSRTRRIRLRIALDDRLRRRLEVQAKRRYLPVATAARMFIGERLDKLGHDGSV